MDSTRDKFDLSLLPHKMNDLSRESDIFSACLQGDLLFDVS